MKGPLGTYGVVVGLAAAAIFLPDGCAMSVEQSARLRTLVTPIVFVLLGVGLARVRTALGAVVATLVGCATWCASIALIYGGIKEIALVGVAAISVAPCVLAALLAGPMTLVWTRRAEASRASVAEIDHRLVWGGIAAFANLGAGAQLCMEKHLDPSLAGVALVAMSALVVLAVDVRRRAVRALTTLPEAPTHARSMPLAAPLPTGATVLDWGLGDARRDTFLDDGAPYRGGSATVWLGDREAAHARLERSVGTASLLALLACVGVCIGIAGFVHATPRSAAATIGFSVWHGC